MPLAQLTFEVGRFHTKLKVPFSIHVISRDSLLFTFQDSQAALKAKVRNNLGIQFSSEVKWGKEKF